MNPYLFQLNRERLASYMYELDEFRKNHQMQFTPDIKNNAVQHYTYGFPHISNDKNYFTKDRYYSHFVEKYSNAKGDYPNCVPSNEEYDRMIKEGYTDAQIAEICKGWGYYKKSGSDKPVGEWLKDWLKTDEGKAAMGTVKTGVGSLWDKIFGTGTPVEPPPVEEPKRILGMKPLTFGIVSVVTIAVVIVVIVKLAK